MYLWAKYAKYAIKNRAPLDLGKGQAPSLHTEITSIPYFVNSDS